MKIFILMVLAALALIRPAAAQQKVVPQGGFETRHSGAASTNMWLPLTSTHFNYVISACNTSSADVWLMAFDTNTTNVANGAVPYLEAVRVPTGGFTGGWNEPAGLQFKRGLLVMSSTTPLTLTNTGAAIQIRTSFWR